MNTNKVEIIDKGSSIEVTLYTKFICFDCSKTTGPYGEVNALSDLYIDRDKEEVKDLIKLLQKTVSDE